MKKGKKNVKKAKPAVKSDEPDWKAFVAKLYKTDYLISPVNISIGNAKVVKCPPLIWNNYEDVPSKLKMNNNGKTVLIHGAWKTYRPSIEMGPLKDRYIFMQMHFHWGKNPCEGSFHTVDGDRHSVELHVVHFKREYLYPETAKEHDDGLAIVVYILKLQPGINSKIQFLINDISEIKNADTMYQMTPWPLTNIIYTFANNYLFYKGKIVSGKEKCSALWLIARRVIGIAEVQIKEFHKLLDSNKKQIVQDMSTITESKKNDIYFVNPSQALNTSLLAPEWIPPKEK